MNIWVQEIRDKAHLCVEFTPEEKPLLNRWHLVISRLTRLDFSTIIERKDNEKI